MESLLQRAAVDSDWYSWLVRVADRCHLSVFRTLKAALPSGWIGQAGQRSLAGGRQMWWIQARVSPNAAKPPTPRQRELLALVGGPGRWRLATGPGGQWVWGAIAAAADPAGLPGA